MSAAGYPTGALAREILHDGPDRVRALISCGGNPVAAWPDQLATIDAMRKLDLLIQIDVRMSATARLAHYVVAPRMSLEVASYTGLQELFSLYGAAYSGFAYPWAQWTDKVVDPPAGSDLLEEWQFFYRVGSTLGLPLELVPIFEFVSAPRIPIDMDREPTTEELLILSAQGSRIPIEEVRRHPGGAVFDDPAVYVEPKDPDCAARLDVGNPVMMADLTAIAAAPVETDLRGPDGQLMDFRLVVRRIQQAYNSSGHDLAAMRSRPYNPAFMHPSDLARLGIKDGDGVEIRSARASIPAIVRSDRDLREGLVSMSHAFGGLPEEDAEHARYGSNTGRLLSVYDDIQPYTGQPKMSNIPIAVIPARRPAAS
jgi:anaerobic selenocysteine-containing dehydrogenase